MIVFQIGVCKGNDDLTEILKDKNIELLVLVEPLDVHNQDINNCYSNVLNKHIENIAIINTSHTKNTTFYYHQNDGPYYEVASIDKKHILKHGYDEYGIIEKNIKCSTINDLFIKYNAKKIDILYIDAEGQDDHIIYSINLNEFKIDNIYFENLHLNSDVYSYLEKQGYTISKKIGTNGWTSLAQKERQ